jgi:tetratricopeptide (TPR) repeat protein
MKRLFLSFSVADDAAGREFVHRLFDRLQQQAVEPWIFESPRGEVEAGTCIPDACRRQIEGCDIFLVFINDGALQSDYVDMEVSHAIWEHGRRPLPIVPLIATRRLRREWPPAFAEAAAFKGLLLPARPLEAIEAVVMHVCECLHVEYASPAPHTPRLPLRQRLADELKARSSATGYPVGDYISLLRKCDLAADAMDRDDYGRARRLLVAVLTDLELEYGITDAYYPHIAYGAVLTAEAHAGRCSFADVERHFAGLIEERGARLDANAFAGRANALVALGRFEEAVTHYHEAESYLESPDSAIFYNLVRARVLGGLGMDRAEIARRRTGFAAGIVTRRPGDLARLTASASLAYAYVGDLDEAMRAWEEIGRLDEVFPELVTDIVHQLHRHGLERGTLSSLDAADGIAGEYLSRRGDLHPDRLLPLEHLRARVLFDRGERRRARQILGTLMERFPAAPILQLDAAMFALEEGDRHTARRLCEAVAAFGDHAQCCPGLSAREFNYALGQAFWLLGRRAEAQESFRRTEYGAAIWYGATMPGGFGGVLETAGLWRRMSRPSSSIHRPRSAPAVI